MKKVYVVNTCNIWKEYASFRLVGIFTSRKKLNVVLNKMLKDKDIVWSDAICSKKFVNKLTDSELCDDLDYVNIEQITLNKEQ